MKFYPYCVAFSLMLAAVFAGLSCTKDDTPTPNEPSADTILTEQKLLGRWEATHQIIETYDSNGVLTATRENKPWDGLYINGKLRFGLTSREVSFIEFLGDHTYKQSDIERRDTLTYMFSITFPQRGNWLLSGADSIRLTTHYDIPRDSNWHLNYRDGELELHKHYFLNDSIASIRNMHAYETLTLQKQS